MYNQFEANLYRNISSSSGPSSGRQSGSATPYSPNEKPDDSQTEGTLVSSPSPPISKITTRSTVKYGKAIKADIIVSSSDGDKSNKEHRERGRVKTDVYKQYIAAASISAFVALAALTVLVQMANIGAPGETIRDFIDLTRYRGNVHPQKLGRTQPRSRQEYG